jgi:hypothetical protein
MKTIEMHVHKDIAMKLQEAQIFHNLPINIHVKPIIHGMVPMTFEYEEEDELLAQWFTDTLIDKYARDL